MSEDMTAAKSRLGPSPVRTRPPESEELRLTPGTVLFQQWRLVRELGRGAFGVVFEARELNLDQIQAVKVLYPSMVTREGSLRRFRREVRTMRSLSHARIGRVYDYREDLEQNLALISMELVPGGTVRHLLEFARQRDQQVPLVLALVICEQTLAALAEAHLQKVIHRDVAPGNVLLSGGSPENLFAASTPDPGVKLVDFGIAGLLEASRTLPDRGLGTVAYMAPEVLSSREVTPAADVYGVGAVVYELLTGEPPLGRFEVPTRLRPSLSKACEAFLLACLERRPGDRPTAAEALERCLELARPAVATRNGVDADGDQSDASTASIPLVGHGVEPVDEDDEISDVVLTTTNGELEAPLPEPEKDAPHTELLPRRSAVVMAAAIGLFVLALGLGAWLSSWWRDGRAQEEVASKDEVATPSPAAPPRQKKVGSDGAGIEEPRASDDRAVGTDADGIEDSRETSDRAVGTNGHGVRGSPRRGPPRADRQPAAPMALLELRSIPEGAHVYLVRRGQPLAPENRLGSTPLKKEVPCGDYEVVVAKPGADCYTERAEITLPRDGLGPLVFELDCSYKTPSMPPALASLGDIIAGPGWDPAAPWKEQVLGIVFLHVSDGKLRPFWMSETDIDQRQWRQLMGSYHARSRRCDHCPVDLDWDESRSFCNLLSRKSGYDECYRWPEMDPVAGCDGYRVLGQAEWDDARRHPDWRRPDGYGLRLVRTAD